MKKLMEIYKEFVEEISYEIAEGVLKEEDQIQILRGEEAVVQDYRPLIDWYYDAYTMEQELVPLEDLCEEGDYSKEEWADMFANHEAYKKQYEEEKDRLEVVKVKDILTEMKQMIKLFK